MADKPFLQSLMGDMVSTKTQNDRVWTHGYLALGQVLKVYPKRYTADVQIFHTSDTIHSRDSLEGKHSCRIGVSSAGFSDLHQAPYGEIIPIQRGNIVLVGFLKNSIEQPVIIKVFHDISENVGEANYRNILPNYFSGITNIGDVLDYLSISPIQDFKKIDRFGNFEISSHTKSFLVANDPQMIDDETFDYEDLSVKAPKNKKVINPLANVPTQYIENLYEVSQPTANSKDELTTETIHTTEKYSKPKKYIAVFRDNFVDSVTNWLKLIVNAAKTSFRLIKFQQKENANTSFELLDNGGIKIRRQLDTRKLFDPNIPQLPINQTQNPSQKFSEFNLMSDGTIKIETLTEYPITQQDQTQQNQNQEQNQSQNQNPLPGTNDNFYSQYPKTTITISPLGGNITINTTSKLEAYAKNGIEMASPNDIAINSNKSVSINAAEGIQLTAKKDIVSNSESKVTTYAKEGIALRSDDNVTATSEKLIGFSSKEGITSQSEGDITTTSQKDITTASQGNINLASVQKFTAVAQNDLIVSSQTSSSFTSIGEVKMFAPNVQMQGNMDMKGSLEMKGKVGMTGSSKFTGKHTINGRGAILSGDIDAHGYRNFARFSSYVVQVLESFCVDQITKTLSEQFPQSSAVLGMLNQATNGFKMTKMGFDGIAQYAETAAFGEIINKASPYYNKLVQYCKSHSKIDLFGNTINLDPTSISVQLEFMEKGLGVDLSNLSGGISIKDQPFLATITSLNNLWKSIGKTNNMSSDISTSIAKSKEFTFTSEQRAALTEACEVSDIQLDMANASTDIGGGELDELRNLVDIEAIPKEGDKEQTNTSSGNNSGGSSKTNYQKAA